MNNVVTDYSNPMGTTFAVVVYLVFAIGFSMTDRSAKIKIALWIGLVLRIVGSYGREAIAADAGKYFRYGVSHAEYFSSLRFDPIWNSQLWWGEFWTGTNFVTYPAGIVATLIGDSWLGMFFLFALMAFVGLIAYAKAFEKSFPGVSSLPYWLWICLLPSMWFWTSSIGKEAMMTLGLGLATLGYLSTDKRGKLLLPLGLLLVMAIRPQVVAVFGAAAVFAVFMDFDRWSPVRLLQGVALIVVGVGIVFGSMQFATVKDEQALSIEEYVEENAYNSTQGGSVVGAADLGVVGVPTAFMNVMFRPFIWEAHNFAALMSAIEVMFIWIIIFIKRHNLMAVARNWRSSKIIRFSLAFFLFYVIALGMNLGNLGIIARQRVLVFPFLFMIVESGAAFAPAARGAVASMVPSRFRGGEQPMPA